MKLVCIKTFDTYIQAHMAIGVLESAGIKGFLEDENMATILTSTAWRIKLLVPEPEKEAAEAILKETDSKE